jgi:hypothetical protein
MDFARQPVSAREACSPIGTRIAFGTFSNEAFRYDLQCSTIDSHALLPFGGIAFVRFPVADCARHFTTFA